MRSVASAVFAALVATACGPADLKIVDVAPGDGIPKDVFVVEAVRTEVPVLVQNVGGTAATEPTLELSFLGCLTFEDDFADQHGGRVDPGAEVTFTLAVTAEGCDVQTIVDWFFSAPEGDSRGTFNVLIER